MQRLVKVTMDTVLRVFILCCQLWCTLLAAGRRRPHRTVECEVLMHFSWTCRDIARTEIGLLHHWPPSLPRSVPLKGRRVPPLCMLHALPGRRAERAGSGGTPLQRRLAKAKLIAPITA